MGKASRRRKKHRRQYLERLAGDNRSKFQREWAKRLESWAEDARERANSLADDKGIRTPSAFKLVEEAMNELIACGEQAINLEGQNTRDTLNDSCCQAVADAVDRRIYRLSNATPNQRLMKIGIHKPPR